MDFYVRVGWLKSSCCSGYVHLETLLEMCGLTCVLLCVQMDLVYITLLEKQKDKEDGIAKGDIRFHFTLVIV